MSESTRTKSNIPQALPGAFLAQQREEVLAAVTRVLDSGWYILGAEVQAFETEFARMFGYAGAIGVGSGTDAIVLALRSLDIREGDYVATVSHTAVATVAAIEMIGASPVFVDIEADSFTIDSESLARTLEAYPQIKAVIAVHLYGNPADMPSILQVAKKHGIPVVEDCAQAHGAQINGFFVGSMADVATFSFYPTKNLGAIGDGGMVVVRDPERIPKVRALREYGWMSRYISQFPGINSRLDELQAAILRVRLPHLEAANLRRAKLASAYDAGLPGCGLTLPVVRAGGTHVYHQYVVRCSVRDLLQSRLKESGIGTNIHYPVPVHLQPAYASRCGMDPHGLGATEAIAAEILSLPMYPELTDTAVEEIVNTIRNLV